MKKLFLVPVLLIGLIACSPKENWTQVDAPAKIEGVTFYMDQSSVVQNSDGSADVTVKIVFEPTIVLPQDPSGKKATQLVLGQSYDCKGNMTIKTAEAFYEDGTTNSEVSNVTAAYEEGSAASVINEVICKK